MTSSKVEHESTGLKRAFLWPDAYCSHSPSKRVQVETTTHNASASYPLSPQSRESNTSTPFDDDSVLAHAKINQNLRPEWAVQVTPFPLGEAGFLTSTEAEKDQSTAETCFGMICNEQAQFLNDPRIIEQAGLLNLAPSAQNTYSLKLITRDNHIALQHTADVDIAVLNRNATRALWAMKDVGHIRHECFVGREDFSNSIRTWMRKGKAVEFPVDIVVYGCDQHCNQIGKIFSDAELFLQHPEHYSTETRYTNPHFLEFARTRKPVLQLQSRSSTPDTSIQPAPALEADIFLDCLDQQDNLRYVDTDLHINTPLLSHQRTGVDFIGQKEGWRESLVPVLWEARKRGELEFYEHIIIGTRASTISNETSGGIIADEMGLGKTLTVLSAIVGSLRLAKSSTSPLNHESVLSASNGRVSAKGTLIIVPSVLVLEEWLREIERRITPNYLTILKYHGPKRECTVTELLNFDIIITTYATVASESERSSRPLYGINWFRIVLDEAHSIRHQSTKQFRAVTALSGSYRWCLTGTPVQNSLLDLGALIRFLRIPLLSDVSTFREHIVKPIECGQAIGGSNLRKLLKSICLRRTRDILQLPEVEETCHEINLSAAEKMTYASIGEASKQTIDDVINGRKTMDMYHGILVAIMRLRLFCNHGMSGETLRQGDSMLHDSESALTLLQQSDEAICTTCSCDVSSLNGEHGVNPGQFTTCGHLLCDGCLAQYEDDIKKKTKGKKLICPICQAPVIRDSQRAISDDKQSQMFNDTFLDAGQSTKLAKLLKDIQEYRCSDKSIVFSSWKKTLRLIAALLTAHRIPFVQIDSSLTVPERRRVLTTFQESNNLPVLLMTLGTGAVGLNITAASRVHIVEPQWNPSTESQAIGRLIRLGQEKQVKVVRYITKNTVEEYIQNRQSRKLQLAGIGWATDKEQKLDELMSLHSVL